MRDELTSGGGRDRRARRADIAGGLAVAGVGVLELLDGLEVLQLSFGAIVPALLATAGVILVGRGLSG